jgi:hypothetical protein
MAQQHYVTISSSFANSSPWQIVADFRDQMNIGLGRRFPTTTSRRFARPLTSFIGAVFAESGRSIATDWV